MSETIHDDGRVELNEEGLRDIESSSLYNEDLAPVPVAKRNWTTYNYAALWISMAHCIPTYMMASSLISVGMNWWQALFTILLGNTIVLAPILLNSHPGTKYGIPFPVFARSAYGTFGSNPAPETYNCSILGIEITGRVAAATVRETDPHGDVIDYFHLLKVGDRWWITSKLWDAESIVAE